MRNDKDRRRVLEQIVETLSLDYSGSISLSQMVVIENVMTTQYAVVFVYMFR